MIHLVKIRTYCPLLSTSFSLIATFFSSFTLYWSLSLVALISFHLPLPLPQSFHFPSVPPFFVSFFWPFKEPNCIFVVISIELICQPSVFMFEEEKGFLDKVLALYLFKQEDEQRKIFLIKLP